jgi:hypothetical protein
VGWVFSGFMDSWVYVYGEEEKKKINRVGVWEIGRAWREKKKVRAY